MRLFGDFSKFTFKFTWLIQSSIFLLLGLQSFASGQLNLNFPHPSSNYGSESEGFSLPVHGNSPAPVTFNGASSPPQFNGHGMANPSVTTINLDFGQLAQHNQNQNQNEVEYYRPHEQQYPYQYQQYKNPHGHQYNNYYNYHENENNNNNYRQNQEQKQREPYKFDREPPSQHHQHHHHSPHVASSNPAVNINEPFVYTGFEDGNHGNHNPSNSNSNPNAQSFVLLEHQSENSNPSFENRHNSNNNNYNHDNHAYGQNLYANFKENEQIRNLTCLLSSTGLNCKIM